jgi:hypothetical protein
MSRLDALNSVPGLQTIQTAYGGVDGMQSSPAPQRVAATAVLFLETCKVLGLDATEMLDKARRITHTAHNQNSLELRALRTYIAKELRL